MKIVIDIGHPGHVHYFKNLIYTMKRRGHNFLVIARDRSVIKSLLDYYQIPYVQRGKGKDGLLGKFGYMLYADTLILKLAYRFKPDLFLSFSSPYAAQVSSLLNTPHITLNDTEHTDSVHNKITYPFSDAILTPFSYQNDLGSKHIKLKCFIESLYLHPKFFKSESSISDLLGIGPQEKYTLLRFVSWKAFHDVNQKGLSLHQKRDLVSLLNSKYRVFISSEDIIEPEFEKYRIKIPPERMHDVLAHSTLFVGESGTMASESALLGVPTVYVNSLPLMCYLKTEQESGLLTHFTSGDGVLDYLKSLMDKERLIEETKIKRDQMIEGFINPTNFLIWFVENWPESKSIMLENPRYQYRFK